MGLFYIKEVNVQLLSIGRARGNHLLVTEDIGALDPAFDITPFAWQTAARAAAESMPALTA